MGLVALWYVESSVPGIEPVSPALGGIFLTTGKVPIIFFPLRVKTIFLYSISENLLSMHFREGVYEDE